MLLNLILINNTKWSKELIKEEKRKAAYIHRGKQRNKEGGSRNEKIRDESSQKRQQKEMEKDVFNKFVQVGRVVQINYGADKGKLAVIVNIVNQNRILIDGEHIVRQVIPIRRIHLTKFQIENVELNQRTVLLKKKIAKFDLTKKYAETSYAKKQAAKAKRANLGDFDRFRVMVLKKKLARTSAKSK
ncbi:hypothetical protein ABPG72_010575 [Tetrahymena utriculariae]